MYGNVFSGELYDNKEDPSKHFPAKKSDNE